MMGYGDYEDHFYDRVATPAESVREWAWNYGAEVPDQCWLLHDYDVWVRNPHYNGPDVTHPEMQD